MAIDKSIDTLPGTPESRATWYRLQAKVLDVVIAEIEHRTEPDFITLTEHIRNGMMAAPQALSEIAELLMPFAPAESAESDK